MNKSVIIDDAIIKTIQMHPSFSNCMNRILFNNCSTIVPKNFTSHGMARNKIISEVIPDDFISFICEQLINIYSTCLTIYYNFIPDNNKKEIFNKIFGNLFLETKNILDNISDNNTNIILYFKTNPQKLFKACDIVANARYKNYKFGTYELRRLIDKYDDVSWQINKTTTGELKKKIQIDVKRQIGINNINIRNNNINKCVKDIISGSQLVNKRNEYNIDGTLFATQDIGNKRKNQEDSVLIMAHPKNSNFKILVVSDGMGGVNIGEYASSETVKSMALWFNSIDPELYYHPDILQSLFNDKISEISNKIFHAKNAKNGKLITGATFVGAIITEKETIVSSVGDSRAYAINKNKMMLITNDEAPEWNYKFMIKKKAISKEELDDYRFIMGNNIILRCIGMNNLGKIQSHRLLNESYDRLLLFSDGITDLLSQDKIAILASGNNLEKITSNIVDESLKNDAIRPLGEDDIHMAKVEAGKDNSTVAMYARR